MRGSWGDGLVLLFFRERRKCDGRGEVGTDKTRLAASAIHPLMNRGRGPREHVL